MMPKQIKDNVLFFDGCNTVELAKQYGTPLYVVSESDIVNKCKEFRECFLDKYENTRVAYASKAFSTLAMCKIAEREGLCLDVVSGGELFTAMKANFPAERIELNGNNKQKYEIDMAVEYGIGRIIIDGLNELSLIEAACKEQGKKMNVLFRINTGVDSDTHDYMVTSRTDSKFGLTLDEDVIYPAISQAINSEYVNFLGFHYHVGSGIFDNKPYLESLEVTLKLAAEVKKRYDYAIKEINVGGGFGIQFIKEEPRPPYKYFMEPIMTRIEAFAKEMGIERPAVVIEPGKGIIGEAGITLYTIGNIKEIKGLRKYVSVDGGMSDNIRTALYGAVYEGVVANRMDEEKNELVTICGKCCESGDILIKDIMTAPPQTGDIFAVYTTGGYNYAFASNYNKNTKAAVVLVKEGKSELIVRRQTYEEVIQNELIPESLK